jgi:hypothetical protein
MACLARRARHLGINSYNTECGHMLQMYENGKNITKEEAIDDLLEYIHEVGCITELSDYYDFLMNELQGLKQIALSDDNEEFVNKAGRVRRFIVDALTLLKLTEWQAVTYGFICEGAAHIHAVRNNLERIGYKLVEVIELHENGSAYDFFEQFRECPEIVMLSCIVQNPLDVKMAFSDVLQGSNLLI